MVKQTVRREVSCGDTQDLGLRVSWRRDFSSGKLEVNAPELKKE